MSGSEGERGLEWMSQSSLGALFSAAQAGEDLWEGRIAANVRADLLGESQVATLIDRFTLLERIGAGAMGEVFAAYDPKLDRRVALKLLNSGETSARDESTAEARSLARLNHPNVVTVHEMGVFEGRAYIAMECVEGRSLRTVLAEDGPTPERIVELFVEAGRGLAAAHEAGVIHRDFKPDNVVVGDDGRVRVADFGLALRTDLHTGEAPVSTTAGTPAYMAPEQETALELTPAVDQFAFCVALWEALCGERPTGGARPGASSLPGATREALSRGLSADPADRWPSMQALLDRLVDKPTGLRHGGRKLALAALAGSGVTAWAWWAMGSSDAPCQGAAAQMEPVWNGERRAMIERTMLATQLPFAAQSWETAASIVDGYAQRWAEGHRDACEATMVRREQSDAGMDMRMSCLTRARSRLDATLELLEDADVTRVERAVGALSELPDLDGCEDLERLRASEVEPEDPEAVEVAYRSLDRVIAQRRLGRGRDARAGLDAIVSTVQKLKYPPLEASVAAERALVDVEIGEFSAAEASAGRALELGLQNGLDAQAISAASSLVYILGLRDHRYAEAYAYAGVARALLSRAPDARAEARLRHAVAIAHKEQGDGANAEAEARRAIELYESVADSVGAVVARSGLAAALQEQRKDAEAEAEILEVISVLERIYGPDHPHVSSARSERASIIEMTGRTEEALELRIEVLRSYERIYGVDSEITAGARVNVGGSLNVAGRHAEAEVMLKKAIATFEKIDGGALAAAYGNLARALKGQGRLEEARVALEKARAAFANREGSDHPNIGRIHLNLGDLADERGQPAEAEREYRAGLKIFLRAYHPGHPLVVTMRSLLGKSLLAQKKYALARSELEQSWAIRQGDEEHPSWRAGTAFALARALYEQPGATEEARARARELASGARDAYRLAGPEHDADRVRVEAWQASHELAGR